mgnify:CR=1 FL=1
MVVRKKRKPSKNIKNKGIVKKNNSASKKINSNFVFKNSSLNVFLRMVVKFPYVFINKTSSFVIQFLLGFFSVFRQMITFSLKIKEAIFGILFGLLSGSIASVVIYSYFNYNSQIDNAINDQNIIDNTNMLEKISSLEEKIEQIVSQNKTNKIKIDKISNIENQLTSTIQNSEDNYDKIITVNEEIKDISKKSEMFSTKCCELPASAPLLFIRRTGFPEVRSNTLLLYIWTYCTLTFMRISSCRVTMLSKMSVIARMAIPHFVNRAPA